MTEDTITPDDNLEAPSAETVAPRPWSLEPSTHAELDDLEERGIEYIKEKLEAAGSHIPNVRGIFQLADASDLDLTDKYALLAYRVLVDMVRAETSRVQSVMDAQRSTAPQLVDITGERLT